MGRVCGLTIKTSSCNSFLKTKLFSSNRSCGISSVILLSKNCACVRLFFIVKHLPLKM